MSWYEKGIFLILGENLKKGNSKMIYEFYSYILSIESYLYDYIINVQSTKFASIQLIDSL
jgi:hypothetical protein